MVYVLQNLIVLQDLQGSTVPCEDTKCASIIPELNSKNLEIPSENTKYAGKGPVKKKNLQFLLKTLC